jgi:Sulfotransferase family
MPVMVREEAAVLFIHIPKCGGSSFEQGMSNRGWRELLSIRGISTKQLKFMRCSPQHMHAELLIRIIYPELFNNIVTLVREPVSRLKSEYAWQQVQGITNLSPEIWIEHVFAEFAKNPFIYDNHIRPQNEFILDKGLIFRLEEDGINQALNIVSPERKKRNIFTPLLSKTRDMKLKVTIKSPYIHDEFQKKSTQIYDFYGKDYELLGYPTT